MVESLLDLKESMRFLRLSKSSFYRLARPHLPRVKHGQRIVRYRLSDLEAYRDARLENASAGVSE